LLVQWDFFFAIVSVIRYQQSGISNRVSAIRFQSLYCTSTSISTSIMVLGPPGRVVVARLVTTGFYIQKSC